MDEGEVVEHLLDGASWAASRSTGPGGQRRDKVSTRAELTIPEAALDGLPDAVAERLRAGLGLGAEPLRINVQEERMLSRNREIAVDQLRSRVAAALAPPPPPRRPTRPSRAARERRVESKLQRSAVKQARQRPSLPD